MFIAEKPHCTLNQTPIKQKLGLRAHSWTPLTVSVPTQVKTPGGTWVYFVPWLIWKVRKKGSIHSTGLWMGEMSEERLRVFFFFSLAEFTCLWAVVRAR